jgi:hypothetical protein
MDSSDNPEQSRVPIVRAYGTTTTEQYLRRLCDRTFLSLWSYANIYRDQGRRETQRQGKELCDLLVVFDNDIVIFSDKACEFPNTGNLEVDWHRWFRRAVLEGAGQIWGAERWIRTSPDRIFLNPMCTQPFPFPLPSPNRARFHRIVVAHNSSLRSRSALGGSGSLMIMPHIIGPMHLAKFAEGGIPFAVGQLDPAKGFVHVLDDISLEIVLSKLDTITDFVDYLIKKEDCIASGKLLSAAGEEELLAFYLIRTNEQGEHDFVVPADATGISITEGHWTHFDRHPQRRAQLAADQISYSWDALIEKFNKHILGGTLYLADDPRPSYHEQGLRLLAREPRIRRRFLAKHLNELILQTSRGERRARVFYSRNSEEPCYVFLAFPPRVEATETTEDEYRTARRGLLHAYCMVAKLKNPQALDIVGIATESGSASPRSEDLIYLDTRVWTPEAQAEAQRLQDELALLKRGTLHAGREEEYPDIPSVPIGSTIRRSGRKIGRNEPCPCGSQRKYKRCCGK